jgi:hypothetical protein
VAHLAALPVIFGEQIEEALLVIAVARDPFK